MAPKPLTIVHVVFSSRIAGGEQYCIDLAHAQAAQGHHVHIIGAERSVIPSALDDAVQYHGLKLPLLRAWRVRRMARRLGAHVVHGHLGPACKAAARCGESARVGTLHVGYKEHQHSQLDGLVCVNHSQPQQLKGYEGRHRVISNWAPERSFTPQVSLREELDLNPAQLLIGAVGRLDGAKGMDVLIAAFKQYAPADAMLAILGEGKQRAELETLIGDDKRVRLLGFRRDVDAALRSMDLFVSPSREESFGLALLEAMKAGLPVLSTATEGPLELLRDQPAVLVPIDNVPALGRAMRSALAALRGGIHGQRQPVRYDIGAYDRQSAVRQVIGFYGELLAPRAQAQRLPSVLAAHA